MAMMVLEAFHLDMWLIFFATFFLSVVVIAILVHDRMIAYGSIEILSLIIIQF